MTATLDRSPPTWAALIWHDGQALYLRLPDSGHITKLLFTEAGLSRGLKLIPKVPARVRRAPALPEPTVIKRRAAKPKVKEPLTDSLAELIKKATS
jgi:hypothetical protein